MTTTENEKIETTIVPSEFSRIIDVKQLVKSNGGTVEIVANAKECAALAERFEYESIDALSLSGKITQKDSSDMYDFVGVLKGVVQFQNEDDKSVKETIEDEISVVFAPNNDQLERRMEEIDADVEPMEFGEVDLGELAAQYLFLLLDAELFEEMFKDMIDEKMKDDDTSNPLAALKAMLQDMEEDDFSETENEGHEQKSLKA